MVNLCNYHCNDNQLKQQFEVSTYNAITKDYFRLLTPSLSDMHFDKHSRSFLYNWTGITLIWRLFKQNVIGKYMKKSKPKKIWMNKKEIVIIGLIYVIIVIIMNF